MLVQSQYRPEAERPAAEPESSQTSLRQKSQSDKLSPERLARWRRWAVGPDQRCAGRTKRGLDLFETRVGFGSNTSTNRHEPSLPVEPLSTLVSVKDKRCRASTKRVRASSPCDESSLTMRRVGCCSKKSRPAACAMRNVVELRSLFLSPEDAFPWFLAEARAGWAQRI
jgi:hypothetical protein